MRWNIEVASDNEKTVNSSFCQACLTTSVAREVDSGFDGRPFRVCSACAVRLENLALRPLEWYRLAALHGPATYLLHDDFYDDDGKAYYNKIPIKHANLFPAPRLDNAARQLDTLFDYAVTRWHLNEEILAEFRRFTSETMLAAMSRITEMRPIPWIECRCYQIAARVLGHSANDWIEARWAAGTKQETLFHFLEAAAACSTAPDVIPRAIAAVERVNSRDLSTSALALARFRSPLVLDWIESQVRSPVSDRWGWLAACSNFSWPVAIRWLDSRRPLSLVALDALVRALCPAPSERIPELVGSLGEAPSSDIILKHLQEYAVSDPAPRVVACVKRIAAVLA